MARMNFCPQCGAPLGTRFDGGRERIACHAEGCGFIHFGDFSIGCAGVVVRPRGDEIEALLVQRGQNPFAGTWQIPGGYAEHDEVLSLAVEREVEEEAGIVAKVSDVVAFRHALAGSSGGPSTNVYFIFRLDYVSGEPQHDGDEIAAAGFYTLAEMEDIEGVQGLSKWGISQVLGTASGSGLSMTGVGDPHTWQIYGLNPGNS
ncbi:MAG: NUDIX hydrolase [Pseudomonadota bacterium]